MTLHVKTGGNWTEVTDLQVKTGGSWTGVQEGYVKDGGTWKLFFTSITATLPADISVTDIVVDPDDTTASIEVNSNGVWSSFQGPSLYEYATWIQSGKSASDYEVMLETSTGTLTSGTADTWQSCGTTRTYLVERTTIGSKSFTGTLKIRSAATGTVLDSATVLIRAQVDSGV